MNNKAASGASLVDGHSIADGTTANGATSGKAGRRGLSTYAYANEAVEDWAIKRATVELSQVPVKAEYDALKQFEHAKSVSSKHGTNGKKSLKKFYKRQHKEICGFEACCRRNDPCVTSDEATPNLRLSEKCVKVSLLINLVLVVLKGYSAVSSGSSSVLASLIENVMDVVSNIILIVVNVKVKRSEPYVYPHGKSRLEPVGIMLFGIVMSMAGFLMVSHSAEEIITDLTGGHQIQSRLSWFDIGLFVATIAIKMTCFAVMVRWKVASIQVLVLDHVNDSMVNGVALVMAFIGKYAWRYADPLGALLIAFVIIFNWMRIVRKHARQVIGRAPCPGFQRQLCWAVLIHLGRSARPCSIRATALGDAHLVDVGVVMATGQTLLAAARLCGALRRQLEARPDVAVAMVTVVGIDEDRLAADSLEAGSADLRAVHRNAGDEVLNVPAPSYPDVILQEASVKL